MIHDSQLPQRFFDGGATPQVQKTDNNGPRHWKVPVDQTSNGFHQGTGCVPVRTRCNFPQCARSNWDSRWHDHLWKNRPESWWKSPKLSGSMQEEWFDPLNLDNMQFWLPKVSFFGHTWSDSGLSADLKKIEAVKKMEIPQDVEMMRSFLGLINYLNWFSPQLFELSDPLRQICRQKEEFQLTEACEIAFHQCKEEISKNITLHYFNLKSPTILQTDASKKGLGPMLLQNSTLVMFASRALTGSEKNYQNLEWECLATIWGMEKFHYFLYGKQVTLETDQKPLVAIYKKHMVEISPRIQCLIVRSFPYQPFNIRYQKGVEIPLADALSRVTPLSMEEDGIQLPIIAVNQVMANIPCSSNDLDQIREETRKDPTLKLPMHYILDGWPCEWRQLPQKLHVYWNYREDLSIEDCNQGFQSPHTFHSVKESIAANTWRTPGSGKMYAESQGVCVLAWNKWQHPQSCGKMWNLPIKFQSSQANWKHQQSSTTPVAHPGNRSVLLEQDQLHHDWWLLYQIHHHQETSKQFHTQRDKGARDGFHRIWMTIHAEKWQWTMLQFQGIPAVPWVL